MRSSTVHPAATRRHRLAGLDLHPRMRMLGEVDLDIGQEGYLARRGMAPPAPYLPSGHLL
jgi:hypothetical protein